MAGCTWAWLLEPSPSCLGDEDDGGGRASALKLAGCLHPGSDLLYCRSSQWQGKDLLFFFPVAVGRRCQLPSCEKNKLPAYGHIRDTTCLPTDRPGGQRRHPYASPQAEERIYLIPSCRCPALHPKVPSCWSHGSIRVSRNAAMESVFKWNFCQKKLIWGTVPPNRLI